MYKEFWGLKEKPFRNTPDPKFLYYSTQHEDALMKLSYAVNEGLGAAMMTGVFGCGKTLLGSALIRDLGKDKYKVAYITNPQITHTEFLRAILRNLKSRTLPDTASDLLADAILEELNKTLMDNMRDGKETIVIIDEAHIITDEKVFEELRLLLNFQLEDRFLLTLLLFGQPELARKIGNFKQLEQRVAVRCHLDRFNEKETQEYISHRLEVAGRKRPIFTKDALSLIFDRSGGIPRRINTVCDLGLLAGFGKKKEKVDMEVVRKAIQDFEM